MNPADWPGGMAYLVVFGAALAEGEMVFIGASVLVAKGQLDPVGVVVAGALGATAGDQLWFNALRGRLDRWLGRLPALGRRHHLIVDRVRRHSTLMILALRFLAGLRVAICAACAYSRVSRVKFAVLNTLGAFAWATALLLFVTRAGPAAMAWIGVRGWWGLLIPPLMFLSFSWWLAHGSPLGSARSQSLHPPFSSSVQEPRP